MTAHANAYIERFIQTVQRECLDHFIVLGERHLNYLIHEYVEHYNTERPHMGIDAVPRQPGDQTGTGEVMCRERLGGLLRHYHRQAA